MAMSYNVPGIYVEEVPSGERPIQAVGTSTAAFLGKAPNTSARLGEAVAITNKSEYKKIFCGENLASTDLTRAVYGFFNNGGSLCYVVNIGASDSFTTSASGSNRTPLELLEEKEDVAIIAAPGFSDPLSYDALITHCDKMGDRIAILDPPADVDDVDKLKTVAEVTLAASDAEGEEGSDTSKRRKKQSAGKGLKPPASDRASFYFPWLLASDEYAGGTVVPTAPSGHLAGIYARTDGKFGVHKAPANQRINGAIGLTYHVTRAEQGPLNDLGINCIRSFPGAGFKVWGARTLSEDAQWRYINVRRLFFMIFKSIELGTSWVVFEPNDLRTWKAIERNIKAFLTLMWRDGALKGATADQAFYVKCDEETNPPEVINAGRLITEIGICPVKPAEFIIFRIGQWEGGSSVETEGETEE